MYEMLMGQIALGSIVAILPIKFFANISVCDKNYIF